MAQHDYTIANQGFPAFRSDLNDALAAIVSNNSGATEPTTMFAHQMWVDTAANPSILKIRNADNDAWITIGSIDQTGDTFTLVNLRTSGPVVFNDAGADVDFRVEGDTDANLLFADASTDRVGCGTNTPAVKFDVQTASAVGGITLTATTGTNGSAINCVNTGGSSYFGRNNSTGGAFGGTAYATVVYSGGAYPMAFYTNDTERMRIDSSGNLLVGTTTLNGDGLSIKPRDSAGFTTQLNFNRASSATNGFPIVFQNNGVDVGYIAHNNTSTSYVTSSDYRLKENVAPITGALAKVLELNPVTYTWKADGSAGEGFIAHELQEVAPYAVTGEKDGEEMQGVDYGKLTPILTAALQEAIAEIQSLKARVAELEAK